MSKIHLGRTGRPSSRNSNTDGEEKISKVRHQKIKHSRVFNFRMLNIKDVTHKYIILLVILSRETPTCQNIALNCATSLLFLLIKYTGKDQKTHTATMKPIPTFHGFRAIPINTGS